VKGVSYFKVAGVKLMTPPAHLDMCMCVREDMFGHVRVCVCMSECGGVTMQRSKKQDPNAAVFLLNKLERT